jgi:hypothetical protein
MEVKQNTFYSIVLTDQEISDLVTAIEVIYAVMSTGMDINKIQPVLKLKDEIVLAANKA